MVVITTTRTTTPGGGPTSMAAVAPFDITTTFTAPSACSQASGGLTMLQNRKYQIWLNEPLPVPGTTITSCYPSQFISSYLLEKGGVTQAAFSPLVCPAGYTTQGPFTSNYIACCPSGWNGIALASNAPSDRPAYSGTCYSNIYNKPVRITLYDDASIKASSLFTATESLAQAYAYAFEGFAFGVAEIASTTGSSTSSIPSSSSPAPSSVASPTPSSTSSNPSTQSSSSSSSSITTSTSSGGSGLSSGAIAGIVIGVLAGLALVALALLALLRYRQRRRRRRRTHDEQVPPYEPEMHQQHFYHGPYDHPGTGANAYGVETSVGGNGMSIAGAGAAATKTHLTALLAAASEMEAKDVPQEMPEEPRHWHELETTAAAAAATTTTTSSVVDAEVRA